MTQDVARVGVPWLAADGSALVAQLGLKPSPWSGVAAVLLIMDVAAIVSLLLGKGSARHKLVWTLLILILPVLGLILYFSRGRIAADRPLME